VSKDAGENSSIISKFTIPEGDDYEGYRQIILGDVHENLYDRDFMRETIEYLNQEVADSLAIDVTIEPTHYYI
jgi:hypothetical protein